MKNDAVIYATNYPVTPAAIARHLGICTPMVRPTMGDLGCRMLPGDRYDLTDLWRRMWGIDRVPRAWLEAMERPLLSVDAVAEMVGVHPATIRRAGNTRSPKWRLPDHCDLGERTRRYLPLHIEAWLRGEPPEDWLKRQYRPAGPLGLRLKGAGNAQIGGALQN